MENDRIKTLDGLRGLAALLVVWYHFCQKLAIPAELRFIEQFTRALNPGYLGVDVFFALSGFLINFDQPTSISASLTGDFKTRL